MVPGSVSWPNRTERTRLLENFIPNGRYRLGGVFVQLLEAYDELVAELRPEHVHGWRRSGHRLKWSWDKDAINKKLNKSVLDEDHFKASQDIQKKVAAIEKRQEKVEQIKEPRQLRKERYAIVRWPSPLEFFVKQEEPCAKLASVGQRPSDESEESKE